MLRIKRKRLSKPNPPAARPTQRVCRRRGGRYLSWPWLMTIGPAGSNPATMKGCFLNPKWYPGKQNDSSQGACVLIGHLNVWIYWAARDFCCKKEKESTTAKWSSEGSQIPGCKLLKLISVTPQSSVSRTRFVGLQHLVSKLLPPFSDAFLDL